MNKLLCLALLFVCVLFVAVRAETGEERYAKMCAQEGAVKHEKGFCYKIITPSSNPLKPTASSKVEVHYEGKLVDGTVFDSSYKRGETISFNLSNVIVAWQLGLHQMNVGSTAELYCPPAVAYGSRPVGPIPANSHLFFKVELFAVDGKKGKEEL